MKKKLCVGMLITTIATSSLGTINTLAAPIETSEQSTKEVDLSGFSTSLRKLGTQSALLQAYGLTIGGQAEINLPTVPSLQTTQKILQTDVQEWLQEILPRLIALNQKNIRFTNAFNIYLENDEMQRIKGLKSQAVANQMEIQSVINELNDFKNTLTTHTSSFANSVKKADEFLNKDSGQIATLKKDIQKINTDIRTDLQAISSLPGLLLNSSTDISIAVWKLLCPAMKGGSIAAAENIAAAQQVLEKAKKAARDQALKDGKTEEEILAILKQVEKDFASSSAGLAAGSAAAKKYDFMDKIDVEQIKKIITAAAAGDTGIQAQKDAILDLAEKNNQLFENTRDLKAAEIHALQILFIQDKIEAFAEQIDEEISYLTRYKKDWGLIEQAIKELPSSPTSSDMTILKKLCKNLEEQARKFEENVTHVNTKRFNQKGSGSKMIL
ncbi:hemolysin BL lytic component L2 (plasmid) [Bacillus thuringiensis]|uniref:Hemolysin BL lytic component L2 n=1 Tax=Bacillus thuringiensis TaxID=1428 RepID=A0A9W3SIQ9_BACTU|nr:HBL/NHE enterotoxin family protein [Bacillus thuringiensis]ANS52208.1 hemolysin BL lytic component L2 [Bacillus thuringiensis]